VISVRVNWRQSVAFTGTVIKYLAVAMLVPLGISLLYGEDTVVFLLSMGIAVAIGLTLEHLDDDQQLVPREARLFLAQFRISSRGTAPNRRFAIRSTRCSSRCPASPPPVQRSSERSPSSVTPTHC
jgi:hypothetical protein